VDLLLLTGRAVVIFDGLDELLDTSRRADVTTRVERFCAEYPLAPVLVTSRQVGYDQLLFTRENAQSAMTERELVAATSEFLQARGFESLDAAREFVDFCRGRMWVFSDAGTTASGERLYAFTHRTFLEYFAAAQLA